MREINECMAEVFRRSEKRIRERKKKRDRILAFCIPLCLIVSVWSIINLPGILPSKDSNDAVQEKWNGNGLSGSDVCFYTEIEIRNENGNENGFRTISDKVEVTRIFSAIHSLYGETEDVRSESETDKKDMQIGDSADQAMSELSGIVITFRTENGAETVYALVGNELFNANEDRKITLTDSQVSSLREILGIQE